MVCREDIARNRAYEEEHGTDAEERRADDGHNPRDTRSCAPSEEKQANWKQESADDGGGKAVLRPDLALLIVSWALVDYDLHE